jgi:hypothetical protein
VIDTTIHEDLLCNSSKYFKKRLEKDRKEVDGECSTCHEDLDPEVDDITFCRSGCGQNIHEKCIEAWKKSQAGPPRCPMCRKFWKLKPEDLIEVEGEVVDREIARAYVNWLYTEKIHISRSYHHTDDDFNVQLLKAWRFAHISEDDSFKHAIIAKFVSSVESGDNAGLGYHSIFYAYEEERWEVDSMPQFIVDACLMHPDFDAMDELFEEFPTDFTKELCLRAMRLVKGDNKMKSKDLLNKYTGGEYMVEGDQDDENDEEEEASESGVEAET